MAEQVLKTIRGRVHELHRHRLGVADSWAGADYYPDDEGCETTVQPFAVVDHNNYITTIPPWWMYNATWANAGYKSPFLYDWRNFNTSDPEHRAYLKMCVETLQEQLMLWGFCTTTTRNIIYKKIDDFTESLKHLYAHSLGGYYDTTFELTSPNTQSDLRRYAQTLHPDFGRDGFDLYA